MSSNVELEQGQNENDTAFFLRRMLHAAYMSGVKAVCPAPDRCWCDDYSHSANRPYTPSPFLEPLDGEGEDTLDTTEPAPDYPRHTTSKRPPSAFAELEPSLTKAERRDVLLALSDNLYNAWTSPEQAERERKLLAVVAQIKADARSE